jgi:hypothetical protein
MPWHQLKRASLGLHIPCSAVVLAGEESYRTMENVASAFALFYSILWAFRLVLVSGQLSVLLSRKIIKLEQKGS